MRATKGQLMSISVAIFLVTMTTVVKGRPSSSEVENVAEALRYLEQIDKYYSQMARPRFGRSVHSGDTANKLDESQQILEISDSENR